jgi:outer membrane protein assembly factor BamB
VSNGELKWSCKFQNGFNPDWKTATTMTIANGVIYFGSMEGNLYAIEGVHSE